MAGTTRHHTVTDPIDPAAPPASNVLVFSSSLDTVSPPAPLARGPADRTLVYVALTRRDLTALDRWLATPTVDGAVRVVDATPGDRAPAPDLPGTSVTAPDALADLGVALSNALAAAGPDPVCSFRSVTALRQYVGRRRAYRFLNAVVDRTAASAAVACYSCRSARAVRPGHPRLRFPLRRRLRPSRGVTGRSTLPPAPPFPRARRRRIGDNG